MSDITIAFAIASGAVPGAMSRFYLTEWSKAKFGTKFPYATFAAVLNSNSSPVYKYKANIMILRMSDLTLGFLALIDQFLALIDQISYS